MQEIIDLDDWIEFKEGNYDNLEQNKEYEVLTKFGIRRAIFAPKHILLYWMASDCTHPLQNCNLNREVTHWRPYVNFKELGF